MKYYLLTHDHKPFIEFEHQGKRPEIVAFQGDFYVRFGGDDSNNYKLAKDYVRVIVDAPSNWGPAVIIGKPLKSG